MKTSPSLKIAYLTYADVTLDDTDGAHLSRVLEQRGHVLTWTPWDAKDLDLRGFDAVLTRSTWDYFQKIPAFREFLTRCEKDAVRIFNSPARMRWNMHKDYLLELAEAGIPTAPMWVGRQGQTVTLASVLALLETEDVVVKPAISGGAWHTFRVHGLSPSEREARFQEQLAARDVIVQVFVPEVAELGEWSLLYFGGVYSHAVRKRPSPGDFRVQHMYGGSIEAAEPSEALRELADRVIQRGAAETLYARVDMLEGAAGPLLMELEVIEPWLYLAPVPGSAERFAEALERAVAER